MGAAEGRAIKPYRQTTKFPKAKPHEGKRILYNLNRFREDLGRLPKGEGEVRRPTAAFSIMS